MNTIINDLDYAYSVREFRKGQRDWSEDAVEYKLYYKGDIIKTDECESHMVEYFVKEDIKNHKK
jgi:hypothetical protein